MPKTVVSPNVKAHQLGLVEPKQQIKLPKKTKKTLTRE